MKKLTILRIVLSILFFTFILFGNWWMAPLLGLLILFRFDAWEVILGAVLSDLLYTTNFGFFGFPAVWTTLAILAFFAFRVLRSKLF